MSKINIDLYFIAATLLGWMVFTWITFLLNETSSSEGQQQTLLAMLYLAVTSLAFLSAAVRKPTFLLVTASVCFLMTTYFMLVTDYWWFWTQLNTVISLVCLMIAIYLFVKRRHQDVLPDS